MADYHPLIARAVAGLDKNTGEVRRALYERARTALVSQLRSVVPALDEAEITRERLSLEEAIRKVEAEAARRVRAEPSSNVSPAPPRAHVEPIPAAPYPSPPAPPTRQQVPPRAESKGSDARIVTEPAPRPPATRPRSPSLADEGLKGFREVAGVTTDRVEAANPAERPSRDPFAGHPAAHDFDRLEPRIDPNSLRPSPLESAQPFGPPAGSSAASNAGNEITEFRRPDSRHRPPRPVSEEEQAARRPHFPLGALIKVVIAVVIVAGLGGLAYWQRGAISGLYQVFRGPTKQVSRDASPTQPKISDRVGSGNDVSEPKQGSAPAVAQRVVLYDEESNNPQGKRYIGSAIWRTETVPAGAGQPPELVVRADVEIPERRITMTFSMRRNADKTLPASHTIEIMFNLPADFPAGGISNVPGILMKQAEQTRGVPLSGLAVKVTTGFFLIGLSAVEADFQRNIQLLKERSWFDIPVVYSNNRRAILAIEKGTPGERAFAEAFAAWKQ